MVNPTLQDVRNRREEIAKLSAALQAEDDELATAEKVLIRLGAAIPAAPQATPAPLGEQPAPAPQPPDEEFEYIGDTIKKLATGKESLEQLIVLLFENCTDDWWTANEVQEALSHVRGKEVPMSSVSPTLTLMKNAGVLTRDGLKVGLATRIKEQTATG